MYLLEIPYDPEVPSRFLAKLETLPNREHMDQIEMRWFSFEELSSGLKKKTEFVFYPYFKTLMTSTILNVLKSKVKIK